MRVCDEHLCIMRKEERESSKHERESKVSCDTAAVDLIPS